MSFEYDDPIIHMPRKGTQDSPFRDVEESLIIDNSGKVILNEYPNRFRRVIVTDDKGNNLYEVKSGTPDENGFFVDYSSKTITFNKAHIGKQFHFKYSGEGNSFIPVNSIYTERDGLKVTETLDQLTETTKQARDKANEQASYAKNQGNYAKEQGQKAQDVADNTRYVEPYNDKKLYHKNNIVTHNGNSYMAKKDTIGNEPTGYGDDEYWGLVGFRGQDGVGSVSVKKHTFVATEGQKVFKLPFSYEPLKNRTRVYVGGAPQNTPENYEETNENTITLTEGVKQGTAVYVEVFSTEFDDRIAEFDEKMGEMTNSINELDDTLQEASDHLEYIKSQGDYAKSQGDFAKEKGEKAAIVSDNLEYTEPYNPTKQYKKNNIVSLNGNSFIAKKDNVGNPPPTDLEIEIENEYWGLVGRKGEDGTGTVHTIKDEFVASEGQKIFNLSRTYDQFQNRTKVTIDGVPQYYPENYDETTPKSITLKEGVYEGAKVVVEYFSQSVPLESDIATTVHNHTGELNQHAETLVNHSNKLNEHSTQLAQTYYYEEITSERFYDEISQTVYYITTVPHKDKNGNLIKLQKEFQNDVMNSGDGETPRSFATRTGATLVTNASIWNNNDSMQIVGIQVKDGVVLQDTAGTSYTLGIKEDNTLVAYPPSVSAQEILDDGVINTFTAFFPMIENGLEVNPSIYNIIGNPSQPNPRQVIAQMPNKDIIFLTCEGRLPDNVGMTYADCIRILLELGVTFAYCLDGGGSAQTVLRNVLINQPIDKNFTEERKVSDFIYFKKGVEKGRELSSVDIGEIGVTVKKHDVKIENKANKNGETFTGRVTISTNSDTTPTVLENEHSRMRFVGLEGKNQFQSGYKDLTPKPTEFVGYNSTIMPYFDIFTEELRQRKSTGLFSLLTTELPVVDDLFQIDRTGFYRGTSGTTNKPSQANCNCLYIGDANNGMLIALTFYTELFLIRKLNGEWSTWIEK
jgi:exopolysaccharide biosynthesis protein